MIVYVPAILFAHCITTTTTTTTTIIIIIIIVVVVVFCYMFKKDSRKRYGKNTQLDTIQ